MFKNIRFYAFIFAIGAVGYCLIEILWRGYTHPTMAFAGGLSFVMIALIEEHCKKLRLLYRMLLGGLAITAIEAAFGVVFNLFYGNNVWDYSLLPFNWRGQICLLYSVLWCFLTVPLLFLCELLIRRFKNHNVNNMPS